MFIGTQRTLRNSQLTTVYFTNYITITVCNLGKAQDNSHSQQDRTNTGVVSYGPTALASGCGGGCRGRCRGRESVCRRSRCLGINTTSDSSVIGFRYFVASNCKSGRHESVVSVATCWGVDGTNHSHSAMPYLFAVEPNRLGIIGDCNGELGSGSETRVKTGWRRRCGSQVRAGSSER